jgi:cytochrome c553
MAENTELSATPQATAQELAEVIEELEQYRERLVNETLATAQRAKLMKKTVMAQMEPELAKIDATLQALRAQQASLTASN